MKTLRVVALCLVCLFFCAPALAAEFTLTDGKVTRKAGGKILSLNIDQRQINRGWLGNYATEYLILAGENAEALGLEEPAVLFCNDKGACQPRLQGMVSENTVSLRLSPDRKTLALHDEGAKDFGGGRVDNWTLFTYPKLEVMGDDFSAFNPGVGPTATWSDKGLFIFNSIDMMEPDRECDYGACGSVSVVSLNPKNSEFKVLFQGTPLCDHWISGNAESGMLPVKSVCLQDASQWKEGRALEPAESTVIDPDNPE